MSVKYQLVPVPPETMEPSQIEKTTLMKPLPQTEVLPQYFNDNVQPPQSTASEFLNSIPTEFQKGAAIIWKYLSGAPITVAGSDYVITYKTPPEMQGSSLIELATWALDPNLNRERPFDGVKFIQLLKRQGVPMAILDPEKVKLLKLTPENSPPKKNRVISKLPIKRKLGWKHVYSS